MTEGRGATATKTSWQLVELHGCWWAYEGELLIPAGGISDPLAPTSPADPRAVRLSRNRRGDCCVGTCLVATLKAIPADPSGIHRRTQ
jgi:hypothetical protein